MCCGMVREGSVLWDGEGRECCGMVRGGRVLWDGEGRESVVGW